MLRFLAPALVGLLLFPGCQSTPSGSPLFSGPLGAMEIQALDRAGQHLRANRPAAALAVVEPLVKVHPWWVEAHRVRQDALSGLHLAGRSRADYAALVARHPDRAEPWYLLGRISFPRTEQERLFRRSLELNDRFGRAWAGLAWSLAAGGDLEGATLALERAEELEPEQVDYLISRAMLLHDSGKDGVKKALECLRKAAVRLSDNAIPVLRLSVYAKDSRILTAALAAIAREPEAPLCAEAISRALAKGGPQTADRVRHWLSTLAPRLSARGLVILARLQARAGNPAAAITLLRKAELRQGGLAVENREFLAALLSGQGRVEESLALLLGWRPQGVKPTGMAGKARLALEAARAKGELSPASLVAPLAQAGYLLVAESLATWLGEKTLSVAAEKALVMAREMAVIEVALGGLMTAGDLPTASPAGLTELLVRLRALSKTILGRDVVGKPQQISAFGIGVFLDPNGSGLPRFFRDHGRVLLLGQRLGRRPECLSARLISREKETLQLGEKKLSIWRWVVEGQGLRPRFGDLAGLALDRHYLLDLEAIRNWAGTISRRVPPLRIDQVLGQPLGPAAGPRGIFSPAALAARCEILARRRKGPRLEERLFEMVSHHEQGHLLDAARFLPPTSHLFAVIRFLLWCQLSPVKVEAELERRSQTYALAKTRWPLLALANAASRLPVGATGEGEIHAIGYAALVKDLAAMVKDGPTLQGVDNVVAGLYRLPPAELQGAAQRILEKLEFGPGEEE